MSINRAFLLIFIVALLLSACDLIEGATNPEAEETPTTAAQMPQPGATSLPDDLPEITVPLTPTVSTVAIRVWIPPEIADRTDDGSNTFAGQLLAFNVDNPEVTVYVEQKQVGGPGGILSYLRSGRPVAPSILPDLIAIPADWLEATTNEGLIFPLENIGPADLEALYPAAQEMTGSGDVIMGYPFVLNRLPHLVYNNNVLTDTLPLTWDRLIVDERRKLVFAADGADGAMLALQFYLDVGGMVADEQGNPMLQRDLLILALEQFEQGRATDFIIPESGNLSNYGQAWQSFLSGNANIVRTSTDFFLQQSTAGLPLEFQVTPGIDRPLTPLVGGWVWAISATDATKKEYANVLMGELISPDNLGAWSESSQILPARRDAFAAWTDEGNYHGFIQNELERAGLLPVSTSSTVVKVLGDAVFQVVTGSMSAADAADQAIAALEA